MNTTRDLLLQRSRSNRTVILEGATGEGVTWLDVADQADRWSTGLPSGPVGLAIADPVAMAANFVAALAAGVLVAPLDPAAPVTELANRVRQLGLRALVTGPAVGLEDLGVERWLAGRRGLRRTGGATPAACPLPALPDRPAAIMASSGTTGKAKIIPLTEAQLLASAGEVGRHLGLDSGERGYSPLPLFHINGLVVGVLSALVSGSSIVVDRHFSRRAFWATASRCHVTWLNLVPAMLAILGTAPESPLAGNIRLARSASAPLPAVLRERFETRTRIPVVETYGMTEAASQITANPLGAVRAGSVGPATGVDLRVYGDRVQIRGDRVTGVYWTHDGDGWSSRPAVDPEGWLDTGDIGHTDRSGFLYLTGRDGDVINRGGEKIEPREVEDLLLSDPRVATAVVVGRPHPTTGEEPIAYIRPVPGAAVSEEELLRLCDASMSRFKRPAQIRIVDILPAGPTGKVRRSEVRALAAASNERN